MVRSLVTKPLSPPKIITTPCPQSNTSSKSSPRLLPRSLSSLSRPCSTIPAHRPSDKLSQRSAETFRYLGLLKHHSPCYDTAASVHSLSIKTAALSDISARTSLLTAYARASDPDSSLALFNEAAYRDVISWNAALNALVLNSRYEASLALFQEMLREGFRGAFDSTTLVVVTSALSRTSNLRHGCALHGMIAKRGFQGDAYICNALIDMYAKCGVLSSSESVFEEMEARDSTSWNSIIHGCLYNGFPDKSARIFREMSRSGVRADPVSLSCVVAACSCLDELSSMGQSVHGWVIKLGYEGIHTSVSNSLVSFYSYNGDVEAAEQVFRRLINKNVVSWNSMFSGLAENERFDEGLELFHEMQSAAAIEPNAVTLVTITQVCGELKLLRQGKSVHGFTARRVVDNLDLSIPNVLLGMYVKSNDLTSAGHLFRTMLNRDLISWNTMINGYSSNFSLRKEGQGLFCELLRTGLQCSLATLFAILPSCTSPEDLWFGRAVHCWELKYGISDVSAVNALMLMYINCGDLTTSSLLFKSIIISSDISSWNTVIVGCVQNGYYRDALETFKLMRSLFHLHPDAITLVSALSACGSLRLLFDGKLIHGCAVKNLIISDLRVSNALLTMYFRCGDTDNAESLFQMASDRNLCSWNCMISGLVQNKAGQRALEYFHHMRNFHLNEFSLVGVLCACTQLGDLKRGREINGYIFRFEQQGNIFISSALIDMYSKCGRLDTAVQIFENLAEKSIASWNSMISAYGFHGQGKKAIELFSKMTESGANATKSTFISLLSACGHSGLIDEGWEYYNCMLQEFGVEPTVEHHVCMVNMLGRAGRLDEAYEFVKEVLVKAEPGVWGALLSACSDHGNLEMAKSIAEHLFCIEPENTGYYVTVSNLYAYSGMWSCAEEVRGVIHDKGLKKPPGCSFIDVLIRSWS